MSILTAVQNAVTVLAVAMQKGGVAKTTTTINLAYELTLLGKRVLVIDLDQQANATSGLGITLGADDGTMFEVLTDERSDRVPLPEVIQKSEHGMDVAPAHLALRKLERTGLGAGGQGRLAREIQQVASDYDVVLIDCPPSLGELTTAAFTAATTILAVVQAGPDELESLATMENTVLDVQEGLNPNVSIDHVLLTRFNGQTIVSQQVQETLKRDWPTEYLGEIRTSVKVTEAKSRQLPLKIHAPLGTATTDYALAASTLAGRIFNDDITH
ncbi:ParA family protein [Tsukamurella ocularis]|uniref:ParA family protein n=1 Tax=Tsukamurella ocularis TaxID=1970234 RepID=UPI00216A2351|nr:ParA family protein [Tsukamurella ocularis]MCS3779406.1 chromosome partitioning protein [Tsukamurella ocularis]MCS3789864.1 chromosome partitioning protein [Tsukamurella ocularis]